MNKPIITAAVTAALFFTCEANAQKKNSQAKPAQKTYYIDVHHLGKVTAADVAAAHKKDLAVEKNYGVDFVKYWVDEKNGDVYCLSSATDPAQITQTHKAAHGLLPDEVYAVTPGVAAAASGKNKFYLDVHELGAGNVTAADVAKAHQKDLSVQGKYGVNFINYWVDEKKGTVLCLSQAPDSGSVLKTHKEAHGLLPVKIEQVVQGQ